MKIYLAAMIYNHFHEGSRLWSRLNEVERAHVNRAKYCLDSYHYVHKETLVKRIRGTGRQIFLDSGAFSAFTQGVVIDIARYCDYILTNQDFIEVASVLDAIGDPEQTWLNQKEMERRGVEALPCFHYGEDEGILKFYAEEYEYITIGGMVPISSPQLKIWLDRIWDRYLTDEEGKPITKVHGFGLTSVPLMARYPWYSVDSSSWVQMGGIGTLFLPRFGPLSVSEHAPQRKEKGKHIDNLAPEEKEEVLAFLEGELGFELDRIRRLHETRKVVNMVTYGMMMDLQKEDKSFVAPQPGLF